MQKPISKDENERRLRLYHAGLRDTKIGLEVGLRRSSVRHWRKTQGLAAHARNGVRDHPESFANAINMYKDGATANGVARAFGLCSATVRLALRREGLLRPHCAPYPDTFAPLREPAIVPFFGRVPDRVIAAVLHCNCRTVNNYRRSLGIPAFRGAHLPPISIYSLDAVGEFGTSSHDRHKDEGWSEWLEESGATVW